MPKNRTGPPSILPDIWCTYKLTGTVDYGFVAANTGNVTLSEVSIVDPRPGLSNLSFAWPGEAGPLAPRESVEASAAT